MSERRAMYLHVIQPPEQYPGICAHSTFDVGQHTVELLDDQAILLLDNATKGSKETVQLDGEETYRLFVTLQEMFREASIEITDNHD